MVEKLSPSAAGHAKNGPTIERRAWIRMPNEQEVCCQPMAASSTDELETGWLGKVRDVSPGGIALILSRRFEPGTVLVVELHEGARHLPVRVIHATPERKGHWIIGCAFASPLSPEEMQTLFQETYP